MRLQKARPLGELRRKAVRGHNVRSKTLSVTQACHLSQSERLFEISIFRWDPNKTLYFKVRIQKAPSGRELARGA